MHFFNFCFPRSRCLFAKKEQNCFQPHQSDKWGEIHGGSGIYYGLGYKAELQSFCLTEVPDTKLYPSQ